MNDKISRSDLKWIVPALLGTIATLVLRDLYPAHRSLITIIAIIFGVFWLCAVLFVEMRGFTKKRSNPHSDDVGKYGIEDVFNNAALTSTYRRTLARLPRDESMVTTDGSTLFFATYPFEPASVFPNGSLQPADIAEVNLATQCQIRTVNGEILFVHHASKEALMEFVYRNGCRVRSRMSIWSGLLDPFLDTYESQQTIDAQFAKFEELGLNRATVDAWRREVAIPMIAYNFGTYLWEWTFLELYDVLMAQRANLSPEQFAEFYRRAMQLATLDPALEEHTDTQSPSETIRSALHSVLLDWYPETKAKRDDDFELRRKNRHGEIDKLLDRLTTELSAAYSEPHRRYHTLTHVQSCLGQLRSRWSYAVRLHEVAWSLLFHDAIYDSHRSDNEQLSAEWTCRVLDELGRTEDEKMRIRSMIMATAHSHEAVTPDEALVLDIDLSILGTEEPVFDEYDRAIRHEYHWVPETEYRAARASVLRSFLMRKSIYRTTYYRECFDAAARKNIERALARLENQPA